MTTQEERDERAHGVTPALRQDYGKRTAGRQAAFVLPYLRPGMNLLDVGCGPDTITVRLAQAVVPGRVTGIDHDAANVAAARALATEQGIANVTFEMGNVLSFPFASGAFDAASDRMEAGLNHLWPLLRNQSGNPCCA